MFLVSLTATAIQLREKETKILRSSIIRIEIFRINFVFLVENREQKINKIDLTRFKFVGKFTRRLQYRNLEIRSNENIGNRSVPRE